jgi:hypothetical protein
VVAVGPDLDLRVPLFGATNEHLHDLVLPEPIGRTRGPRRRGVVVEGSVDLQEQAAAIQEDRDAGDFVGPSGFTVPGRGHCDR